MTKLYIDDTGYGSGWIDISAAEKWKGKADTLYLSRLGRWIFATFFGNHLYTHEDALDWFSGNNYGFESTMLPPKILPQLDTGEM